MNIDQIIGKLMGDGFDGEEKSALEAWKKEAEDNIKALQDIQKIAALSNTLKGYEDFDADKAWDSFSASMGNDTKSANLTVVHDEPTKSQKTSFFTLRKISRIAAILIVVIGSLFVVRTFLNTGDSASENVLYAATTEMLSIDMKDGTDVTLDKASSMKVLDERTVSLEGRAHFDVARDENKQFSIEMPVGKVVVLGTEFTIDADDKSTEIYVKEGRVRYEMDERSWTLVAGDFVRIKNNELTRLKDIDDNYNSWKDQRLIFRDNNMVEVVDALSRHFKKEIIIKNKKDFSKCNVMDQYSDFTLNDILNGLSKTHGLRYELKDDKVYIVSAKC